VVAVRDWKLQYLHSFLFGMEWKVYSTSMLMLTLLRIIYCVSIGGRRLLESTKTAREKSVDAINELNADTEEETRDLQLDCLY
jgi:hypothetical protein